MALNYSHRPIFSGHLSEGIDVGESQESDIVDLLPADPFEMDITSTVSALTGWLEDLEVGYGGYGGVGIGTSRGDYSCFAELNFIWSTAMNFQAFPGNSIADDFAFGGRVEGCSKDQDMMSPYHGVVGPVCHVQGAQFVDGTANIDQCQSHELVARQSDSIETDGSHPALGYALGYLGVIDLLAAERVCKSWRYTIRNDPLLWKCIHIGKPLSDRITDDVLVKLTNRAHGHLQCLSLEDCTLITDVGLSQVLQCNVRMKKLSIPGCTRLTMNGVVNCLKTFNSVAITGIKKLRIGGHYGLTLEHYEEFKALLGIKNQMPSTKRKPRYYHTGRNYPSCDDDPDIDVQICPRCQKLRLIYDCPLESCRGISDENLACRACRLCIYRCAECGRCITDGDYQEDFYLEWQCSSCYKETRFQIRQEVKVNQVKCSLDGESSYSFPG